MAGFVLGTHGDLATEIAAGHTVGSLHGLRQGAGDGADDGDGEKDGNRNGEHASDQHIPLQRSGGSFGPLTCFDRGLGLKLNLLLNSRLVGKLRGAILLFQQLGGFVLLPLLDHGEVLHANLCKVCAPLLHARQNFFAFFRDDQRVKGFVLRVHFRPRRGNLVHGRLSHGLGRENRQIAHLDGLHIHPVGQRAQCFSDGDANVNHILQLCALARRLDQADRPQRDEQQHHDGKRYGKSG
ncbi:hypothetical protein D3C71_1128770 [compost metagenome]